jgi:DNA-directed RNA polymerase beta' subunit
MKVRLSQTKILIWNEKFLHVTQKEFHTKILKGYSKIHELKLVSIGLASPEKIQSWAEKELPNGKIFGEVTNPNTFHYKTFKPSKGGLFCERIFGPIKDFECACGKRHKPNSFESKKILQHQQTKRLFCPVCDVEYTWSILRRYQLGYIKLYTPVAHLWYFKTNPSYLSIFFDIRKKDLEAIIYCTHAMTLENIWKANLQEFHFQRSPNDLYQTWQRFLNFEKKLENYQVLCSTTRDRQKEEKQLFRNNFFSLISSEKVENPLFSNSTLKNLTFDSSKKNQIIENLQIFESEKFHIENFKSFSGNNLKIQQNLSYLFLFSQKKTFFFLLKKQKNKHIVNALFQKQVKQKLEKIFEKGVAILFAKNFLSLDSSFFLPDLLKISLFLKFPEQKRFDKDQKKETSDFLKIFLFFEKRQYFLKFFDDKMGEFPEVSKQTTTRRVQKFLFSLSLYEVFFSKKEQKISSLTKLSQKEFVFLLNILPILQKVYFYLQHQFLKMSLFKIFVKSNKKKSRSVFSPVGDSLFPLPLSSSLFSSRKTFLKNRNFFRKLSNNLFPNSFQKALKPSQFFQSLVFEKNHGNQWTHENIWSVSHNCLKFQKICKIFQIFEKIQFFSFSRLEKKFSRKNFSNLLLAYLLSFFSIKQFFQKKLVFDTKEKVFFAKEFELNFLFFQKFFAETFNIVSFLKNPHLEKRERQLISKSFQLKIENSSSLFRKKIQQKTSLFSKNVLLDNFERKKNGVSWSSPFVQKLEQELKNPILVIPYNYIWEHDADWKYFLYYSSFFCSDYQDIPILSYQRLFPAFLPSSKSFLQKNFSKSFFGNDSSFVNVRNSLLERKSFFCGAGIFEKCLGEYSLDELKKMIKQHQILLPKLTQNIEVLKQTAKTKKDFAKLQKYFHKREYIIRRLKLLRKFLRNQSTPSFFLLKNLPVLPPDLRPILKLENQIAASDLNRFYQRILYRNDRIKKFAKDSATNQSFEMKYAQRLLQEAVDNLIQNGKGAGKAETNSRGQPLKSLAEILKGKEGRFRQYLLGKRVDYSGRSVIVVGPKLKVYECGIPQEMALELFLPFLIQKILQLKIAQTVIGAKNLLKNDSTLALHFLQKILKNTPVLLNRAPTLHKLGFQAFLPKLVEGRAILLHPMVCPGFNADFDGDQMAVHIPLTVEARTEAWKFMLSFNNFINSATGEPNLLPSQDMVLGSYYLTVDYLKKFSALYFNDFSKKYNLYALNLEPKTLFVFQNFREILTAYQTQKVFLHTPVWVKVSLEVNFGNDFFKPHEFRFNKLGEIQKIYGKLILFENSQNKIVYRFIRTTVGRVLMNFMIQDCLNS